MKSKFIFSTVIYLIAGYYNLVYSQQLPVLDLATAMAHPSKIALSDFVESITYLQLETTPECLINNNPEVILLKDYILTRTSQQCLLFDRKSGKFIREIGHYGKGPGEFRGTYGFFDEISSIYYFIGWNGNLLKYSLDGKFLGSLEIPGYNGTFENPSMPDRYTYLSSNLIVCNYMNINGLENKSFMIFDTKGKIIKTIPNRHLIKNVKTAINTGTTSFHHFNNKTFYQEFYNDTVFTISLEEIKPYFILNRGKYRPQYEALWWTFEKRKEANMIYQPLYLESSRFLTFEFYYVFGNPARFFALYDKTLKSLKVTENNSGIKNDIDGFMDLTLKSINQSGELSCLIQSQDIIKWFENNKDKIKSLKTELQNLKNINLGDNPVIVIAKYKN